MDDNKYIGHKLELILDEIKAVHEAVAGIREVVDNQPTRDEFNELKQRGSVAGAAIQDLSRDLDEHKRLSAHVAYGHA